MTSDILDQMKEKKLIVFPFGRDGKAAVDIFLAHGYNICAIWDNNKYGQQYRGISVEKPAAVNDSETAVLLCAGESILDDLLCQAQSLTNCVYFGGDLLRSMELTHNEYGKAFLLINQRIEAEWSGNHPEQLVLHSMELPITDRCSLKCRDCCNLMQYFTQPTDADVDQTLADADRVLESVDRIEELRLLGGEPFVSKMLYRYVKHFASQKKIDFVHIFSNGTIVPKGENLACLKHPNVFVNISNYGKISKHLAEIKELFQKERILYRVAEVSEWTNCASIMPHNRTDEQLAQIFGNCCASRLLTLRQGRLFICPFAANAQALRAIPKTADESLEIANYSTEELRQKIRSFLDKPYFAACDFCAGRPRGVVDIPAAVQTPTPLPYHKYDD